MNKEHATIKAEAEQEKNIPTESVESPEKLSSQSEKEVASFKKEGQEELSLFESGEMAIDDTDKEALRRLDQEAEAAKNELLSEIDWTPDSDFPPPLPDEKTAWDPDGDSPPPIELNEEYKKISGTKERTSEDLGERSVENIIKRNNVFIVHKIEDRSSLRHNANSNVSQETTYEDDMDILLSLEPSISSSSFTPGEKTNLWSGASGFLIGGGQIGEVGSTDIGTISQGIKERGTRHTSIEQIDEIVGRKHPSYREDYERFGLHNMNEIVVNNPEVFGFFQHAGVDEKGHFWAESAETRYYSEKIPDSFGSGPSYENRITLKSIVDSYRERFTLASERGVPLYVMTDNREVFECLKVNDNGTIGIGKKLTPEEVATGRAGLPPEKRKAIGKNILEKNIFKNKKTQEEAQEIIENL